MAFSSLSALAQRSAGLDPVIAKAKQGYSDSLTNSLEAPTLAPGDAYLSGILRLLPILAGYAIAGKKGAVGGYAGGSVGATSFLESSKQKGDKKAKKSLLEAEAYKDTMKTAEDRQIKLQDSLDDKTFTLERDQVQNAARAARSGGMSGALSSLASALSGRSAELSNSNLELNPNAVALTKGAYSPEQAPYAAPAAPRNQSFADPMTEAVARLTGKNEADSQAYMARPDAATDLTGRAKLTGMGQDARKGELEIDQKGKTIEKTDVQIDKGKLDVSEAEKAKNYSEAPLQIGKHIFVPDPSTATLENTTTAREVGKHYNNALNVLENLKQTVRGTSGASRVGGESKQIQQKLDTLANSIRAAMKVDSNTGQGGSTNYQLEAILESLPNLNALGSNIGQYAMPEIAVKNFTAQLNDTERLLTDLMYNDMSNLKLSPDSQTSGDLEELQQLMHDPEVVRKALELGRRGKNG